MVKTFGGGLTGTFTMIMAGSALLWVQTRREASSDALNHQRLFRLQLTLLTGLSCPEIKETFVIYMESFWMTTVLLWGCYSVNQTDTEEALSDLWVTFNLCSYLSCPLVEVACFSYCALSLNSQSLAEILSNFTSYRGLKPTHLYYFKAGVSFQFLKCSSYHFWLTARAKFFRISWNHTFRLLQRFKSRHLMVKAEQRSVWIFMRCFISGQRTDFSTCFCQDNPNKVKRNSYRGWPFYYEPLSALL